MEEKYMGQSRGLLYEKRGIVMLDKMPGTKFQYSCLVLRKQNQDTGYNKFKK